MKMNLLKVLTPETWYGNFREQVCKRTSYNGNIRKNYAGIGFSYDPERDAFIPPKPFDPSLATKRRKLSLGSTYSLPN
jgi:hypothetical protein